MAEIQYLSCNLFPRLFGFRLGMSACAYCARLFFTWSHVADVGCFVISSFAVSFCFLHFSSASVCVLFIAWTRLVCGQKPRLGRNPHGSVIVQQSNQSVNQITPLYIIYRCRAGVPLYCDHAELATKPLYKMAWVYVYKLCSLSFSGDGQQKHESGCRCGTKRERETAVYED